MRLHLAGSPGQTAADAHVRTHLVGAGVFHYGADADQYGSSGLIAIEAVCREAYPYQLITFAYERDRQQWADAWRHHPCTVMVDSGAFTVHQQGSHISLARYAQFIRDFPSMCPDVAASVFVSLDVIGDQAATWTNYRRLVQRGCEVLPVVTFGAAMDDVRRAVDAYPYVCLGGLVGKGQAAFAWLDQVYGVLRTEYPVLPRTHLLGLSTRRALLRYPAFSCDSSSWLQPFRWGADMGGRRLPAYHSSPAASAAMRIHMQRVVRDHAELARDATLFWKLRGVTWPE